MNCIFGRTFQSRAVTGNISTLQATAHTSSAIQSSRFVRAMPSAPQPPLNITIISSTAIHEMMRLK